MKSTMDDDEDEPQNKAGETDESLLEAIVKRKTLVSPWKNVEEFHQVYDWLFAADASDETLALAVAQLRIWRLRRTSLCPAAVSGTIVLVEMLLKDVGSECDQGRLTEEELQTLYASAFTRFFNYMSSIMQTHNMRTMYDTANQLGLPTFVVDLRHLCAHGLVLPPLEVLRVTTSSCYTWLHDFYWRPQLASMSSVDASQIRRKEKTQLHESVSQLFALYNAALECYCKGARDAKTMKRHLHGKRRTQLQDFMKQKNSASLREAFNGIVKDLALLLKRETSIKDLTEIYIEALLNSNYFFIAAEKHSSSTEELQSLIAATQSLFRMLAAYGFIEELFVNLVRIAENPVESTTRRVGASFWATQIVNGFVAFRMCKQMYKAERDKNPKFKECDFSTLNSDKISNQARELLVYSGVDSKTTLIFGTSVRRPCVWVFDHAFLEERLENMDAYTAPLIKSLLTLADPPLNEAQIKTLAHLISVQEGQKFYKVREKSSRPAVTGEKVYTAKDLLVTLNEHEGMDIDASVTTESLCDGIQKYGVWSTLPADEAHDWTTCPLGRLPWE